MVTPHQGSAPIGNNNSGSISSGNNTQRAVATGNKSKKPISPSIFVYFVLPYLASMKANELPRIANELSQLESCCSHPNGAFLQSLDICKSAREEGDVDSTISQRSNSLVTGWSVRLSSTSWLHGLKVLWNKIYRFPSTLLNWFLLGDDDRVSLHRYWFWTVIPPMLPYMAVRMLNEGHADLNAGVYYRPPAIFFFVVSVPCVSVFYLSFPGVVGGILVLEIVASVYSRLLDVSRLITIAVVDVFLDRVQDVMTVCPFGMFLFGTEFRYTRTKIINAEPFLIERYFSLGPEVIAIAYAWKLF